MLETIVGDLYDYPPYYDLAYGSDWKAESAFLQTCFERYARRPVRRVFEPACGTGRLLLRLAQAGYEASGLDLNARAVDYCNRRLARHGFPPSAWVGDMADFTLPRQVDAAFNAINSFRHLPSEAQARAHLQCVARCLRRGGVYVLSLHLTPTRAAATEGESWAVRRGHLAVLSRLWVIDRNTRRRQERVGMSFDVYTPSRQFRIAGESCFRTYTAGQLAALVRQVGEFEITAVHDFSYDADKPVQVDARTEDAVYILRRR